MAAKLYNTYYNINNEMEVIKPKLDNAVVKQPAPKSKGGNEKNALINAYSVIGSNTTLISVFAGAATGLLFSIFTKKNYAMNILIGAGLGYAGSEFMLKKKTPKAAPAPAPQMSGPAKPQQKRQTIKK